MYVLCLNAKRLTETNTLAYLSSPPTSNDEEKSLHNIYTLAASNFGEDFNPANVLVFEDAPLGVEAALRANMKCVWISESTSSPSSLAHQQLKSLEDFKPELWDLPKFDDE
jgi:pseudouridine-5'-monophosphatase